MWKCKNLACGRTFPMLARISTEKKHPIDSSRLVVERYCCPFCEGIEFEEIKQG